MSDSDAFTISAADDMPKPENCNKLGILAEEAEQAQSGERFSWGSDRTYKRHIYKAAYSGDWIGASSYEKNYPEWVRTPLTASGNTALHVAVSMKQTSFVTKLVECMSMQDTEIRKADGNTAFCMAAISGNVKIATILFRKNPGLVWVRGQKEMLPIQLASSAGQPRMVEFLSKNTQEDLHNLPFHDIVRLFFLTITNSIYPVALNLLDRYPELASKENEEGLTAVQLLSQSSFDEDAPGYRDTLSSLFRGMEEEESLNSATLSKAMFDATKSGNVMILEYLFKYHPDLLMEVNSMGQSLLHIAILYRQETVHRLILSKGASHIVIMQLVDFDGNNVLHLAGKMAPEGRFGSPTPQVLMSSEEKWFQEVEKIVPPSLRTMRNKDGWTAKELFYKEHKELSQEAVSELKGMANTFLVVATLIVTLGITGALTIPVKDIDTSDTPIFKKKIWYMIFLLSIASGTCFCAASMVFYTSVILPSNWKPKHEYVGPRQIRFTCGNGTLFISLGIMIWISVTSGAILLYDVFPSWIFYVIAALASIPMLLNFIVNYNLWSHRTFSVIAFCMEILSKAFPISRVQDFIPNKAT